MLTVHVLELFRLIFKNKFSKISIILITCFCVAIGVFFSLFAGLVTFCCYLLGLLSSFLILNYPHYVSLYFETLLKNHNIKSTTVRARLKASCSVCDVKTCRRHDISKSLVPWKEVKVSSELNQAIQQFYNRILSNFILTWYQQFTDNKEFLNELKYCLRFSSATLINRFFQIDSIDLIVKKLVPQIIKHIDDYLYMQQFAKTRNLKFNDVMVEHLGNNLHPAITNRTNELDYLRHLGNELIKHLLPAQYTNCKNYLVLLRELLSGWVLLPLMDVIAEPNIINSLVIITVNYNKNLRNQNVLEPKEKEEFLCNFIELDNIRCSPFALSLNKIKNSTEYLYSLMQFLKREDQVHWLTFCLDVDDFNSILLTPEFSEEQLKELHSKALKLYEDYFNEDSLTFIGCSKETCKEFLEFSSDMHNVAKLRSSKSLYQAYDFACNQLESMWLPQFFHSNEFYSVICGPKITTAYTKAPIKSRKYYEQTNYSTVSKISSGLGKIKGVLKTASPIQGSIEPLETDFTEDEILIRDLSNWKVKVSSYQITPMNKVTYFCLNVYYVDNSSQSESRVNNWTVWRKDQDFFTLKAKLVEFHGESEICDSPLPSRKAGSMVESRISKYEDFITSLLQKPSLRGSDLLHTFLTSEEDFTLVISTMASNNQDFGNIYQSMAYKLRKEKGQNLDSFISTFVSSVKQKQERIDIAEEGLEMDIESLKHTLPRTFTNNTFKDNLGISYKLQSNSTGNSFNPTLFSESLFYLLKHVFKVNIIILKIYVVICNVAQQIVDLLARNLIEKTLKLGLTQHNLAFLVEQLEEVVFHPHTPHTSEEYEERKRKAFDDIKFCPTYLNTILGGQVNEGLKTLLEILQNPCYNKQLCYNLLDTLLLEMFPELKETS
ncbi:hypothetical protein ABEB36_001517 [Hypothenemus hampei]|uniref:Sorting nexin-14-like n=1 Tax=Hypothenemus hampei TaxID=57062 RepID=A0ABD1FGM6_HYPHA